VKLRGYKAVSIQTVPHVLEVSNQTLLNNAAVPIQKVPHEEAVSFQTVAVMQQHLFKPCAVMK